MWRQLASRSGTVCIDLKQFAYGRSFFVIIICSKRSFDLLYYQDEIQIISTTKGQITWNSFNQNKKIKHIRTHRFFADYHLFNPCNLWNVIRAGREFPLPDAFVHSRQQIWIYVFSIIYACNLKTMTNAQFQINCLIKAFMCSIYLVFISNMIISFFDRDLLRVNREQMSADPILKIRKEIIINNKFQRIHVFFQVWWYSLVLIF